MNKKLKKFLVTILGVVVSIGAVVGGYFLFVNLAKVTINDLKILDANGKPINDTSVYLSDQDHNKFVISPSINTSNGAESGYFSSSNSSVARVRRENSNYIVEYYKAGEATITLYSQSTNTVSDSFVVTVYEDFIQKVTMYQMINGEQHKYEDNVLNVYGNGQKNVFGYISEGMLEGSAGNDMLFSVVNNYNKSVIKSVELNQTDKELYITTNLTKENSVQTICLQTYYYDADGNKHVVKNFEYQVNIIGFDIQEIQLIVCNTHELDESNYLYLNTSYYPGENTEIDNDRHPPKRVEDRPVGVICLSKSVKEFYFKIRIYFTDGTYENPQGTIATGFATGLNYYKIYKDNPDYFLISLGAEELLPATSEAKKQFSIRYTCQKTVGETTVSCDKTMFFYLTYLKEDALDSTYDNFINKSLYVAKVDALNNILYYEYRYWDIRYQRKDEITDASGKIIGFSSGFEPNCNKELVGE